MTIKKYNNFLICLHGCKKANMHCQAVTNVKQMLCHCFKYQNTTYIRNILVYKYMYTNYIDKTVTWMLVKKKKIHKIHVVNTKDKLVIVIIVYMLSVSSDSKVL